MIRHKVVDVEQESVEEILEECPNEHSQSYTQTSRNEGGRGNLGGGQQVEGSCDILGPRGKGIASKGELQDGSKVEVSCDGQPDSWYYIPHCPGEYLQQASKRSTLRPSKQNLTSK